MREALANFILGSFFLTMGLFILFKGKGRGFLFGALASLGGLGIVTYGLLMLVGAKAGIVIGVGSIALAAVPYVAGRGVPARQLPAWIALGRVAAIGLFVLGLALAVEGVLAVTGNMSLPRH